MSIVTLKLERKRRRKRRIRASIFGTSDCPRISVYKSNRYLYMQAIDDTKQHTIAAISNAKGTDTKTSAKDAFIIGQHFGKQLHTHKITSAVFDRNGNLYHGVVRAVAEGIRDAGIKL